MKKNKRILSVVMACVLMFTLVLAMSVSALAANITITDGNTGGVYNGYRLLDLTTSVKPGTNPVEYNYSYTVNAKYRDVLMAAIDALNGALPAPADDAAILAYISGLTAAGDIRAFANAVYREILNVAPAITPDATSTTGTFNNVDQGYWLISEVTPDLTDGSYSLVMLDTAGQENIQIKSKHDVPTIEKEVLDDPGGWGKLTDVNIGDPVYFRLTGTLPSDLLSYEKYTYIFHDKMSAGLTYGGDGTVKVYLTDNMSNLNLGRELVAGTDYTITSNTTGNLDIKIEDVLSLTTADGYKASPSSLIVVTFTAYLNENAIIGNPGNDNKVYLEYSNNPYDDSFGETPEEKVVVFTFELDVNKVDGTDKTTKLKDAEFVLYRMNGSVKEYVIVKDGKVTGWTTVEADASVLKSDANGLFQIIGLDKGTYFLEEKIAPNGYNLLDGPIKIEIIPSYDGDKLELKALVYKVDNGSENIGNIGTGVINITVENFSGTIFPPTGGIGQTIFIIVGTILMLGAGVALVVRKKLSVTSR